MSQTHRTQGRTFSTGMSYMDIHRLTTSKRGRNIIVISNRSRGPMSACDYHPPTQGPQSYSCGGMRSGCPPKPWRRRTRFGGFRRRYNMDHGCKAVGLHISVGIGTSDSPSRGRPCLYNRRRNPVVSKRSIASGVGRTHRGLTPGTSDRLRLFRFCSGGSIPFIRPFADLVFTVSVPFLHQPLELVIVPLHCLKIVVRNLSPFFLSSPLN